MVGNLVIAASIWHFPQFAVRLHVRLFSLCESRACPRDDDAIVAGGNQAGGRRSPFPPDDAALQVRTTRALWNPDDDRPFRYDSSRMRWAVGLILFLGLLVRLPGLSAPPLEFHATRQYLGAILARAYYVEHATGLPPAQVAAARAARSLVPAFEPPILQRLTAGIYRVIGREDLRVPRLLSIVAWLAGALALAWLLTLWELTRAGVLAGVSVMVFLPFGIVASRSIQPDPLMTALIVAAAALAMKYTREPTGWRLVAAIGGAAAAAFVKPMAICLAAPFLVAATVRRFGVIRGVALGSLCAAAALVPILVYFRIAGRDDAVYSLLPALVRQWSFWEGWGAMLHRVAGWPLVVAALAGLIVARRNFAPFLGAWMAGYIVLGLAFFYAIATHDYYSLPVVPVLAAGVASLASAVDRLQWPAGLRRGAIVCAIAALLALNGVTIHAAGLLRSPAETRAEAARYERIGELVGHSLNVASLDFTYGLALSYHGRLLASNFPLGIDLAVRRLAGETPAPPIDRLQGSNADFFVATHQPELDGQPELKEVLAQRFPVIARDGTDERWNFVIYDLRRPRITIEPARRSVFVVKQQPRTASGSFSLWSAEGVRWRIEPPAPELFDVRPREGTGPATVEVVAAAVPTDVDRIVEVPIFEGAATVPATRFSVRFKSLAARPGQPPFGAVEGDGQPAALVRPTMTFQGWALDELDLRRVWAGYEKGGKMVAVAEATPSWMRPDVAGLFPNAHDTYNNAWLIYVGTSAFADVPRPVVLRFFAESGDGRRAEIGSRTIVDP
jgi:hypothetical protein